MRKTDYELIASAFRYGATIPADKYQLDWVADLLATKLAKADPKFNRDKFLELCGLEEQSFVEMLGEKSGKFIVDDMHKS